MEIITKTYYKCELCGSQYDNENNAKECESFHKKNLVIKKCFYDCLGGYAMPLEISVVADDGTEARYFLKQY